MKNLFLFSIILVTIAFTANSCKPEPVEKPTDNWPKEWYIPQDVLDYFYFQPGTYWVYENDKTKQRDTIVIATSAKGLTNATPNGERYEVAAADAISKLDGYTYKYALSMQGSAGCIKAGSINPCFIIDCSKFKTGDVKGTTSYLILPFKRGYGGQANGSFTSKITMKDTFADLVISGKTFNEIIVVNIDPSLTNDKKNYNYFWAKEIGIIKKENLSNGENWNLIDHVIIK